MSQRFTIDTSDTWDAIRAMLSSCTDNPDKIVTHMTADVFSTILRGMLELKDTLANMEAEEKA